MYAYMYICTIYIIISIHMMTLISIVLPHSAKRFFV